VNRLAYSLRSRAATGVYCMLNWPLHVTGPPSDSPCRVTSGCTWRSCPAAQPDEKLAARRLELLHLGADPCRGNSGYQPQLDWEKATTMPRRSPTRFFEARVQPTKNQKCSSSRQGSFPGDQQGIAEQGTCELAIVAWQSLSHSSQNWPRAVRGTRQLRRRPRSGRLAARHIDVRRTTNTPEL